ncbi:MAG: leucine-rich repeat protein [Prolixibacteraceae bacterium]
MLKPILVFIFLLSVMLLEAQVEKVVQCQAGGLASTLTKSEQQSLTHLTVTGTIDARDFKTMRDSLSVVSVIDLSGANIASYSGAGGTQDITTSYAANTIPAGAFYRFNYMQAKESLTQIVFPKNIIAIDDYAFQECIGLEKADLPSTVRSVEYAAFFFCRGLKTVSIPAMLTHIYENAFIGSGGSFSVDNTNPNYSSQDGVLFNKNKSKLLNCPTSKAGVYTIPSSVRSLNMSAFRRCSLLTGVNIPSTITVLSSGLFDGCTALSSIEIPSSVTTIEYDVFFNCSALKSISIPESVTTIGMTAFYGTTALKTLVLPSSIRNMGIRVFEKSGLSSVSLSSGMNTIVDGTFYNCFYLTHVEIPSSITSVGDYAFRGCDILPEIVLPPSVTSIGDRVFSECRNLTSVELPAALTSIGSDAFAYCRELKSIVSKSVVPVNLSNKQRVFYLVPTSDCVLYVPVGSAEAYGKAMQWKDFTQMVEMGDIQLSANTIKLGAAAGSTATIDLVSDVDWKVSLDENWLKVTPTSGAGNAQLEFSAESNVLNSERSARVMISGDLIPDQIITVLQNPSAPKLSVDNEQIEFNYFEDSLSLQVKSNISWMAKADQPWLSVLPSQGNGDGEVVVKSALNMSGAERKGKVTFSANGVPNIDVNVSQAKETPMFIPASDTVYIDWKEGSMATLNYYSNADWHFTSGASYLSVCDTIIDGQSILIFTMDKNSLSIERLFKLTVHSFQFNDIDIIVVQAPGEEKLYFSKSSLTLLPDEGSSANVKLTYNTSWSAKVDQSWLEVSPDTTSYLNGQYQSDSLTITAAANTTGEQRSAHVTVLAANGSRQTITVTQLNKARLSVSSEQLVFSTAASASQTIELESNADWRIEADESWVSTNYKSGSGNRTIKVNVTANSVAQVRIAELKIFVGDEILVTIRIVQEADGAVFGLSAASIHASHKSTEEKIVLNSNRPVSLKIDAPWVKSLASELNGSGTITLVFDENTTSLARTATLQVVVSEYMSKTVSLSQDPTPQLIPVSAGNLYHQLSSGELSSLEHMALEGTIDARDFKTIRDSMPGLRSLDLSAVSIVSYTGLEGTESEESTFYPENTIPNNAFYIKKSYLKHPIQSIILPDNLDAIGDEAFYYCQSLTSIVWPSSLKIIGAYAFDNCKFTYLTLPNSITSIGDGAFIMCNQLVHIDLPESLTSLGRSAFIFCSKLSSIVIPDLVIELKVAVFGTCTKLTTLVLPAGLKHIGTNAFADCTSLTSIYAYPENPVALSINNTVFRDLDKSKCTLFVPQASIELYQNAAVWQDFGNIQRVSSLKVTTGTNQIGKDGGQLSILIDSEISWMAGVDQTWLSLDINSGEGKATVSVSAEPNTKPYERYATVTFVSLENDTVQVQVVQEAALAYLTVENDSIYLEAEFDNTTVINLLSNLNWTLNFEEDWLNVDTTQGEGNAQITIFANVNMSLEQRKANLVFTAEGVEPIFVALVQEGAIPFVSVPIEGLMLAAFEGSSDSVIIQSNTFWQATTDQEWVQVLPDTLIFGNATITIRAAENNSGNERDALLSISGLNTNTQTILIKQVVRTGAEMYLNKKSPVLFPNPVSRGFTIVGIEENSTLTISDLNGKVWMELKLDIDAFIPTQDLINGVYLVTILNSTTKFSKLLLKQ